MPARCWSSPALVAIAAAVAATQVDTDAGLSTLVGKGDPTYEATQRVRAEFGEEPVVVLVKESLPKLLLGKDLLRLLHLEGCLSGKVPKGVEAAAGRLRRDRRDEAGLLPRRPGDLPQRGGRPDRRTAGTDVEADPARHGSANSCSRWRPSTGSPRLPEHRKRRIRLDRRLRPRQGARHAEGAARLPLPELPRRPDRHPTEAGPVRIRTPPRDRPDQGSGRRNDAAQGVRRKRQSRNPASSSPAANTWSPAPPWSSTASPEP